MRFAHKTNPERLTAAEMFLATITGPLALNARQRTALAPLLLETIDADGWQLGEELLQELTRPQGAGEVKTAAGALRYRIKNLRPPRPRAAPAATTGGPKGERCEYHPGRPADNCPPCRASDTPSTNPVDDGPISLGHEIEQRIAEAKAQLTNRSTAPAGPRGGRTRRLRTPRGQ